MQCQLCKTEFPEPAGCDDATCPGCGVTYRYDEGLLLPSEAIEALVADRERLWALQGKVPCIVCYPGSILGADGVELTLTDELRPAIRRNAPAERLQALLDFERVGKTLPPELQPEIRTTVINGGADALPAAIRDILVAQRGRVLAIVQEGLGSDWRIISQHDKTLPVSVDPALLIESLDTGVAPVDRRDAVALASGLRGANGLRSVTDLLLAAYRAGQGAQP